MVRLAEQDWKGVPHSLCPFPDFARSEGRSQIHHPRCEGFQRESLIPRQESWPVDNFGDLLDAVLASASNSDTLANDP